MSMTPPIDYVVYPLPATASTVPLSSSDPIGSIASLTWDDDYYYIKVDLDTWLRVPDEMTESYTHYAFDLKDLYLVAGGWKRTRISTY